MKVALVYDRVNKWGGAERILLELKELFPNAVLYTSVYNRPTALWAKEFKIKTSFLQKFPFAKTHHEWYAPFMPLAFESFDFDTYDVVISVTSEAGKGILTKPHTKHVCICLTPTRYLWSGYKEYFKNIFFRFLSKLIVWYLQTWDVITAQRPDYFIAISKEVQERIKKYYGRESMVLYPPLTLGGRGKGEGKSEYQSTSPYFLVVSRLVPPKRIDIAINACNKLQVPLKIIGIGSHEKKLKKLAGPTIEFLGDLTDYDLVRYYMGCCALIFPGVEDFGLTSIEAQSFGKPVIAYRAGGVQETIIPGKTGEFFYQQTEKELLLVLQDLLKTGKLSLEQADQVYYEKKCRENAKRFGKDQFKKKLIHFIENI